MCQALVFMNRSGFLHRNIKPDKIFLSLEEGQLKLGDFGISFLKIEEDEKRFYFGSRAYTSPDVFNKSMLGPQIDIWSLAVTIIELLDGKLPFGDEKDIMTKEPALIRAPIS